MESLHHFGDVGGFDAVAAGVESGFSQREFGSDGIELGHEVLADVSVLTVAEDLGLVVPIAKFFHGFP